MTYQRLSNYLRTYRKRAHLTQKEVAFLVGSQTSANVCRHEQSQQSPNLHTLLAYEMLFRTPVRNLYGGTYDKVADKLMGRIHLLLRRLTRSCPSKANMAKMEVLNHILREQESIPGRV